VYTGLKHSFEERFLLKTQDNVVFGFFF